MKNAGIKTSEITNKPRILIPATRPNSLSNVLFVKKNTPKPIAAVRLVKKVTMLHVNLFSMMIIFRSLREVKRV